MHNKCVRFFLKNTLYKNEDILSVEPIHNGFVNDSYYVSTKDQKKYQVRLTNYNHLVNRNSEHDVIINSSYGKYFVFFNKENGNYIKEWIDGYHPENKEMNSKSFLRKLNKAIIEFHSIKVNNKIKTFNYFEYFDLIKDVMDKKHILLYNEIVNNDLIDNEIVLSHNDINKLNLLITKNKIVLIDFEWSTYNNRYWDYANFIRESDLTKKSIKYISKIAKLDIALLYKAIYVSTNYAYQWTFAMQENNKILEYREKVLDLLNNFYKLINK